MERVEDIPDDFVPDVLGRRTDVISAIVDEVAFADFTDPSWGHIDTPEFSIEVNLSDDPVRHFALHLRGGDIALGLIDQILHRLDAHALDPQSETGLFSTDTAPASLQRWRAYRDAVIHPH
jgi:hypothetical protein